MSEFILNERALVPGLCLASLWGRVAFAAVSISIGGHHLSGFQEILLILVVIIVLFFLPRMVARPAAPPKTPPRPVLKPLPGRWRLALLITVFWLLGAALWLQPWHNSPTVFFGIGAGPVLIFWGVVWVAIGFKKFRR